MLYNWDALFNDKFAWCQHCSPPNSPITHDSARLQVWALILMGIVMGIAIFEARKGLTLLCKSLIISWWSQGDSNPRYRRESWACAANLLKLFSLSSQKLRRTYLSLQPIRIYCNALQDKIFYSYKINLHVIFTLRRHRVYLQKFKRFTSFWYLREFPAQPALAK